MILDDINKKILEDYKSGNNERRVLLQTLKSSLLNRQKDLKDNYNEQEEIKVLSNELKQRKEALEQFKSASRDDLVKKNQFEIEIIEQMLPEQMNEAQIEEVVKRIAASSEDKSFGSIMKQAMQELQGKADGKTVSALVNKHIS